MDLEKFKTPQELEEWMDQQTIDPAEPSTPEYYESNKNDSFNVNLHSDIRGRAIVFVMTKKRTPGWQDEVWALYKMYKAIRFEAEFVYDPTFSEIREKLKNFVRDDQNKEADMVFIAFCGHGCTTEDNQHDVYLKTADDVDFNISAECQLVLNRKTCQIKNKPKVFLVQACRDPVDENINKNTHTQYIRKLVDPASLMEYMFVFASQPGEGADRPYFSESVSKLLTKNSCKFKLQDILGTQITRELKRIFKQVCIEMRNSEKGHICNQRCIRYQRPQLCMGMTYDLNIFPWDTRESDPQRPVEVSSRLSYSVRSQGMKSNPNKGNPSGNTPPDKSTVTGADGVPQYSNPCLLHRFFHMFTSWIPRKTDKDNHRTKQQGEHRDKANCKVIVNTELQQTSPYNSLEEKEDAQKIMLEEVSKSENKRRIEEKLSDDLETPVEITKVSEGSVIIHMTLEEEEARNILVFMSDTGLLSSRMQLYLVTKEYLDRCKAEMVKIKATVKSEKMPPLLEELLLECIVENENVSVKCPFEAVNEGTWFKDGCRLEMTERHTICLQDGKPIMKIVKATMKDRGRYKCEYTGLDDRIHIMECSILVYLDPPKNVCVTDINTTSAVVRWSAPDNNLPCTYNVYYWPQLDAKQEPLKQALDTTSCRIENLTPGETYLVSVTSIPHEKVETEHSESGPEPINGLRLDTKPSKPTNVQVKKDKDRVEIGWQPGPGNNSGFMVRYNEIGKDGKHPPTEIECTNTSLTLDELKPNTEYSFTVTSLWYKEESDESKAVTVKTDNPRVNMDASQIIEKHMRGLVESIDVQNTALWQKLIQLRLFTLSDMEYIKEEYRTNRGQVREILSWIRRGPTSFYQKFRQALIDTNQRHVVDRFLPEITDTQPGLHDLASTSEYKSRLSLSLQPGDIFGKNRVFLITSLDLKGTTLGEILVEKGLLTITQFNVLQECAAPLETARECVSFLDKRIFNKKDWELFLQALEEGGHGVVAKQLQKEVNK